MTKEVIYNIPKIKEGVVLLKKGAIMGNLRAKIVNANFSGVNLFPHLNKTVRIISEEPAKRLEVETLDGKLKTVLPTFCLGSIGDSSKIFLSQCN